MPKSLTGAKISHKESTIAMNKTENYRKLEERKWKKNIYIGIDEMQI